MPHALFIIAQNGFRDEELLEPKAVLESAGIHITISAGKAGKCVGRFGAEVMAEKSLAEVSAKDFDAVVFVGGGGAEDEYSANAEYFRLAKEAKEHCILGAICIAPKVLSESGVFSGIRLTGFNNPDNEQKKFIEAHGGIFTGEGITIDKNIITANGPQSAGRFGEEIRKMLEK
jgi:protease I